MPITFLPNHRLGLRWSLLSVAAIAAIAAAANYEEPMYSPAPLVNTAVSKTTLGAGKPFVHGSISGVLVVNPSVAGDALEISASLRALASMDREWRDLLAPRSSTDRPRRASFWNFVTGARFEDPDTEYSEVIGEDLDEKFFREMRMLLAKRHREARRDELARAEEEAAARAASASFRAGLLVSLSNPQPEGLSAGTDFWQTMATASVAPINVHPQGEASGSNGNSAPISTSFSTGEGGVTEGNDRPLSFWPQPIADQASGSASNNLPAPTNPFPSVPMSPPNSGAFGSPSGNGAGPHYPTASSQGAVTGNDAVHTGHNSAAVSGHSPAAPTSAPTGTVTAAPQAAKPVVTSQSGSLIVSQASVAAPLSVPVGPTWIYVANFGANTLNEYDQATGNPTAGFTPISLSNVNQVAMGANGVLYVMTFTGTIGTYNASTGAVINPSVVTGINQAEGMVLSGNTLYVTSFGQGLLAFDATTGASVAGFSPPKISGPRGIAISGNHLYVVSNINDTVGEYDATTGAAIAGFNSPSFSQASAVAVNGSILYVADISAGHIGEYNAATGATINSSFISTSGTIFQISVSGNDIYVPFFSANALGVYDLTTGAADPNYTSLSGLNHPYGALAIPEPGSAVLLAAGVVALLGCERRRSVRKDGSLG